MCETRRPAWRLKVTFELHALKLRKNRHSSDPPISILVSCPNILSLSEADLTVFPVFTLAELSE